jgi:hypothetical protein
MAKEKISELTAAAVLDGTELVPVVQDGETVRTTTQDIADLGGGGAGYLVYTAILSQTGTAAPVATVLENTLGGTVVWTRDNVGVYIGTLAGVFTANKTFCFVSGDIFAQSGLFIFGRTDANTVTLVSYDLAGQGQDDTSASIEIRVYP